MKSRFIGLNRTDFLAALAVAALTIALGFTAWWTFVPVAFVCAFALSRFIDRALLVSSMGPAIGWLLSCLVRDVFEDGRISVKLASLLHVRFAFAVYLVVLFVVAVPSFFAAYSGTKLSELVRRPAVS